MKSHYEVHAPNYHYNTGQADNRHQVSVFSRETIEEAIELAGRINLCVDLGEAYSEKEALEDELLFGDGYFTDRAKVFRVDYTEFQLCQPSGDQLKPIVLQPPTPVPMPPEKQPEPWRQHGRRKW